MTRSKAMLDDPALYALPHPKRWALTGFGELMPPLLDNEYPELQSRLKDLNKTLSAVATEMVAGPRFLEHFIGSHIAPANTNYGGAFLTLMADRFRLAEGRVFQVRDNLDGMLAATDLGEDTPTRFVRLPYPLIFIEFGETRQNPHRIHNPVSGAHVLEGAYLCEYAVARAGDNPMITNSATRKALKIDPDQPCRIIDVVLIGSPIGKRNLMDDASSTITLVIQDENQPLGELIRIEVEAFNTAASMSVDGLEPVSIDDYREGIGHVAKALLYLNLNEAECEAVTAHSDLMKRLQRSKGRGKQAKIKRRLERTYDRVVVGPRHAPPPDPVTGPSGRSVAPHWRRGHFKHVRVGVGRRHSKLVWIQPTLVAAHRLSEVKTKTYEIR